MRDDVDDEQIEDLRKGYDPEWIVGHSGIKSMAEEIKRHRAAVAEMKQMLCDLEGDPKVESLLRDFIAMHEDA